MSCSIIRATLCAIRIFRVRLRPITSCFRESIGAIPSRRSESIRSSVPASGFRCVREVVAVRPFCQLVRLRADSSAPAAAADCGAIVRPLCDATARHSADLCAGLRGLRDRLDGRQACAACAGAFHLDDYIDYVRDFVALLGPGLHVMAVCQPAVPVLAAVSLLAEDNHPVRRRHWRFWRGRSTRD